MKQPKPQSSELKDCPFCKPLSPHLILKNYRHWTLILDENQVTLGWSLAIHKGHIEFFEQLKIEELAELKAIVKELKSALNKTFKPDWFNVMQCGNMVHHLHFHLAPRYKAKREFEGTEFIDTNYGRMPDTKWAPKDKKLLTKLRDELKRKLPK